MHSPSSTRMTNWKAKKEFCKTVKYCHTSFTTTAINVKLCEQVLHGGPYIGGGNQYKEAQDTVIIFLHTVTQSWVDGQFLLIELMWRLLKEIAGADFPTSIHKFLLIPDFSSCLEGAGGGWGLRTSHCSRCRYWGLESCGSGPRHLRCSCQPDTQKFLGPKRGNGETRNEGFRLNLMFEEHCIVLFRY